MKKEKQSAGEVTGTVIRYTSNKHNDIDGLVVDQQGTEVAIKFPPHTARSIRDVAKEGDTVKLGHHQHKEKRHLTTIKNSRTHRQFDVDSVKPPHPSETGRLIPFTIPGPQYTHGGKHGEITGVVFEDKYIHLHPEEYEEGEQLLSSAAVLHVKAKQRIPEAGFVNAQGHSVYHAHSFTTVNK